MTNRLLILSIFAAMSTASIHAQERITLKVNVPFRFHAGRTTLPAGIYTLRSNVAAQGILTVQSQSEAGGINIRFNHNSTAHPQAEGKLVFQKYGDEYFLSEVYSANSTAMASLAKSAQERELMAKSSNPDRTILVARRK